LPVLGLLRDVMRVRLASVGMAIIVLDVAAAIFSHWVAPLDPLEADFYNILSSPSALHWLGTDHLGRDEFSRLVYGSRISLQVGIVAVSIAVVLGVPIGLIAAYLGGWMDTLLTRLMDALFSFPSLLLALAISAALGPGAVNVMIAIGITYTPVFARIVRSQALSVAEEDYVKAAKASGARPVRIIALHIWPNSTAPIIVQASLVMAYAILWEAALSFLGVGTQPPTPTWGMMLRQAIQNMNQAPLLAVLPGAAIFLMVLSFNFVGDALRDVLDPRLGRALGLR
jgi:peptide/nickel transport system permease protein